MEQEKLYDIYINDKGQILIAIKARHGEPQDPYIIYDGKDIALFYRDSEHIIALDYINPDARTPLNKVNTLVICELDDEKDGDKPDEEREPIREYEVRLSHVDELPISTKDLPKHLCAVEEMLLKRSKWGSTWLRRKKDPKE